MLTEDGFHILLRRFESLAGDAARANRLDQMIDSHRRMMEGKEREVSILRNHFDAAEKKFAEWAEYASQLRSAIDTLDPTARRKKKIVLPDMPRPLETDIPF